MANIIFLLAITLFVKEISCNSDILSKFNQHTYKLKDIRTVLFSYNKNYVNILEIKSFKYNRTTVVLNATVNLKENFGNKLELLIQAYKFLSNEYRPLAVRFQVNVKKSFDANIVGIQNIRKCGNVTDAILYKEITYHICYFVVDETKMPPLLPSGMYKVAAQILYLNQEVAMYHSFFEIYTPIAYPKN